MKNKTRNIKENIGIAHQLLDTWRNPYAIGMKSKKSTAYPIIFAAIISGILIILANLKATGEAGQITNRLTLQEDLVNAQYDIENTYNFILRATQIIINQTYIELAQSPPTPCGIDSTTSAIILQDHSCEVFETTQSDNLNIIIANRLNQKLKELLDSNPKIKEKLRDQKIELSQNPSNPQDTIILSGEVILNKEINSGLKTKLKKDISFARENRIIKLKEVIQKVQDGQTENNDYYTLSNIQPDSTNPDCNTAELILKGKLENLNFQSNPIPIKACPQSIPAPGPSLVP